jgi:hypothetical protein
MSNEHVDAMYAKLIIMRLQRIVEDSHNSTPIEIIRGELCKIVNKKCAKCGDRMHLHDIDYGNQDLCWRCESYLRRGDEIIAVAND